MTNKQIADKYAYEAAREWTENRDRRATPCKMTDDYTLGERERLRAHLEPFFLKMVSETRHE